MDKQFELARDQIIGKIEPITRFNRDSFEPESRPIRLSTGKAFWQFVPDIFIKKEEQAGRLPSRVTKTDNLEKLEEVAGQALKSAKEALPGRIEAWLRINERTDRTLEASNCFDGPKIFGYDFECKNCDARGWVPCDLYCQHGSITCDERTCTNGQKPCSICNGKGEIKCNGCHGKGKDSSGTVCRTCNGQKTLPCVKNVRCERCNGTGMITCQRCHGTTRIDCPRCEALRYLHTHRIVECTVEDRKFEIDTKSIEPKGEKSEIIQQLQGRNLVELRELATVTQMPPIVQNNIVKREYKYECLITEVTVPAAGEKLDIIGFGDKAHIFNYKFIGSVLLDADLKTLNQTVANTPYRLWGNSTELLDAARRFLESEVNITIDNPKWRSDSIITASYIEQAKTLIHSALEKLYFAKIGIAIIIAALFPIVVFLVRYFRGTELVSIDSAIGLIIILSIAWILLERRTHRVLVEAFDEKLSEKKKLGEKLKNLIQSHPVRWKARGIALTLVIILILIAAILPLP